MPVDALGRNINATSRIEVVLSNTSYSVGFYVQEAIRTQRRLVMADLYNKAGNRVSVGYDSLVAAIEDFSNDPSITSLLLGTSYLEMLI